MVQHDPSSLFIFLVFLHFWADWVFQTQEEATTKSTNWRVRLAHCIKYGLWFIPVLLIMGMGWWQLAVSAVILVGSHFIEDSYVPVFLWAKYIRKMPELRPLGSEWRGMIAIPPEEMFKRLWHTPIGAIIFITIDQLIHITLLWPVVWLLFT